MTTITHKSRRVHLSVLLVTVLLAGASMSGIARSESSEPVPCPTQSPGSPAEEGPLNCVAAQLLNPSVIGSGDPKVSDVANGSGEGFELVTVISQGGPDLHVVVSVTSGGSTQAIGVMKPVPAATDTWTLTWDVPDTLAEGPATLQVEVFKSSTPGALLLSSDQVTVDLQHKDPPPAAVTNPLATDIPAVETSAITWPTQAGPLGFYKPADGLWRTVIDGTLSAGANGAFTAYYSSTPIGKEPAWTSCGTGSNPTPRPSDGARPFQVTCTLADDSFPSQVTAVALVPQRTVSTTAGSRTDIGAAAAHRVRPYIQSESDMAIALAPVKPSSASVSWPSGSRRVAGSGCLEMVASVSDHLGRPVQGANVDLEVQGPGDGVAFGSGAGAFKAPPGFNEQEASNCSGGTSGNQGLFTFADAPDAKRIESDLGTGLPIAGSAVGAWRFRLFTPAEEWGESRVYAWVDSQPRAGEHEDPTLDDETHSPDEPLASASLQWLEKALTVKVVPATHAPPTDSCSRYEVKLNGGSRNLEGANVDIHVQGPTSDVSFCDPPGGGSDLSAPDAGEHGTEEERGGDSHPPGSARCPDAAGPPCLHREGVTDAEGRLVFGLSSDKPGSTSVTAWFDGDSGSDDDLNDISSFSTTGKTSWIDRPDDVTIALVNPSGYPGARTISGDNFRVVATVDAPYAVPGLVLELSDGTRRVELGAATQVTRSRTFEFPWDLRSSPLLGDTEELGEVPDGSYTLRARVPNEAPFAEAEIVIDRVPGSVLDAVPPEGVEIVSPANGRTKVVLGETITVEGIASPGAEGVDLFYSTSQLGGPMSWASTRCGYVDLVGTGAEPQPFEGTCTIPNTVNPAQITGLAAVAFDCLVGGCDAHPNAGLTGGRNQGSLEGGDAVTMATCMESPCITTGPSEWQAEAGECIPIAVEVTTDSGPATDTPVELRLEGPADDPYFCDPTAPLSPIEHVSSARAHTDQNGLIETLGVASSASSFGSIFSRTERGVTTLTTWIDTDADGLRQPGESVDRSIFHWDLPGRCTIIGTEGDDLLNGSVESDKICGLGGHDTIYGQEGDDVILGGSGDDTLIGDEGNDILRGQVGEDVLVGGSGGDRLLGGPGDTLIYGGSGRDRLDGGPGTNGCRPGKGKDPRPLRCHFLAPLPPPL